MWELFLHSSKKTYNAYNHQNQCRTCDDSLEYTYVYAYVMYKLEFNWIHSLDAITHFIIWVHRLYREWFFYISVNKDYKFYAHQNLYRLYDGDTNCAHQIWAQSNALFTSYPIQSHTYTHACTHTLLL